MEPAGHRRDGFGGHCLNGDSAEADRQDRAPESFNLIGGTAPAMADNRGDSGHPCWRRPNSSEHRPQQAFAAVNDSPGQIPARWRRSSWGEACGQLLVKRSKLEQIQAQFLDRHDPGIGQGRLPQQGWSAWLPVLGAMWVARQRKTQAPKTIGQGTASPGNFARAPRRSGTAPPHSFRQRWRTSARSASKVAKHDVAVAVDQTTQPEGRVSDDVEPGWLVAAMSVGAGRAEWSGSGRWWRVGSIALLDHGTEARLLVRAVLRCITATL